MADHALKLIPKGTVVRLTKDGETIASASWQVKGLSALIIMAGTEATQPTVSEVKELGYTYGPNEGERDVTIQQLFKGLPLADVLYVWSEKANSLLFSYE